MPFILGCFLSKKSRNALYLSSLSISVSINLYVLEISFVFGVGLFGPIDKIGGSIPDAVPRFKRTSFFL